MLVQGNKKTKRLHHIEKTERTQKQNKSKMKKDVIYKTTVTTENEIKQYVGSTGRLFKEGGKPHQRFESPQGKRQIS